MDGRTELSMASATVYVVFRFLNGRRESRVEINAAFVMHNEGHPGLPVVLGHLEQDAATQREDPTHLSA